MSGSSLLRASALVLDFSCAQAWSADSTTTPPVNSEVFRDVVIAPGQTVAIDSTMDYSSAASVAVTVQCLVCGSAATSLGSAGLLLQAAWRVPDADTFVAAEYKAATAFPYWDAGGALFNIYGSQFRLNLQNKGSQTIAIHQITIFQRSQ